MYYNETDYNNLIKEIDFHSCDLRTKEQIFSLTSVVHV